VCARARASGHAQAGGKQERGCEGKGKWKEGGKMGIGWSRERSERVVVVGGGGRREEIFSVQVLKLER
jgi:hypothetical protein